MDRALEERLISAVRSGDAEAFRALVLAHEASIYGFLMRQIRDTEVSLEMTQEVFFRAYRGIHNFRSDASFKTWLFRIALNVARSWFGSREFKERKRKVDLSHAFDAPAHESSDERKEIIAAAVGALKPKFREVVALVLFEGRTWEEAAEILEIPLGTVCSRMNTAIELLRKRVKKL